MKSMFIDASHYILFASRGIMGSVPPKVPVDLASRKAFTLCRFQGMYCKARAYLKVSPVGKSGVLHFLKAIYIASK